VAELEKTYLREGTEYLARVEKTIGELLKKEAIQVEDIHARTKNLYRVHKKLRDHDMDIKRVYDLLALRIIVPTISHCYEALGIIHREFRPMVGRIKDYISLPKPNGYQSLHTTIFGPEGRILEIQIRTSQMNDEAEYGIAAHWLYNEKHTSSWKDFFSRKKNLTAPNLKKNESLSWITQLREWQKDIGKDNTEFMEGLKIEFFKNHIFAFTPKGDIIELPEEATPVDFAYAIHTEVGHRTNGAKANGKMVSLDYHIQNGDVLEIMQSKNMKKPNKDWLRLVKTTHAKQSIRREHRDGE
jgi:GTP pyrophosphokinase